MSYYSSILDYLKDYKLLDGQGFIYIFQQKESGLIKIGRTNNIEKRLKTLQNQSGNKIINYYISEPMYLDKYVEKILHNKFSKYRCNGEYFSNVQFSDVVDELKNICNSADYKRRNVKTNN